MNAAVTAKPAANDERKAPRDLGTVPLDRIWAGANVRTPDPAELQELTLSVRQLGILEPVLVAGEGPGMLTGGRPYALVAGFRRVAAAKAAGLKEVPARLLDVQPSEILEIQLVENIQREGLSELEEARAFQRYLEQVQGATQDALAKRIGKAPSYVSNRLRLLKLEPTVLTAVEKGKLSASHAEVIASAPPKMQAALGRKAAANDLTVRELENERSYAVQQARSQEEDRKRSIKRIEGSKFKLCPTCKLEASPSRTNAWDSTLRCSKGHQWSGETGKPYGPAAEKAPPKPTLPEVDPKVKLRAPAPQIAGYLLAGSSKIDSIEYMRNGKKVFWTITGERSPEGDLPGFYWSRGEAELSEAHHQPTDADRRKLAAQKLLLEKWVPKVRGKK